MKSPDVRQKSKASRHRKSSESSSRSSSPEDVRRKRKREEEPSRHRDRNRRDEKHSSEKVRDRSRDRTKHAPARDNKKASPSRDRDHRQDRRRDEDGGRRREDRGERWEDEERRYPPAVKREPQSDNERDRRRDDRPRGRGRGGFRGRGRGGRFNANVKEEDFEWGKAEHRQEKPKPNLEKEQPNFGLSGKLTEATNTVNGVVVKYAEPPESRKPTRRWRFYVFKGDETMPTLYIHRQSAYLIGKDRRVADIRLDHPSVSAQHAALQYRLVSSKSEDGLKSFKAIRPYVIDLESSNGTFLNNKKIEPRKYYELREKDVLKFGFSSREYVVLHEHSQDDDSADEHIDEGPNA